MMIKHLEISDLKTLRLASKMFVAPSATHLYTNGLRFSGFIGTHLSAIPLSPTQLSKITRVTYIEVDWTYLRISEKDWFQEVERGSPGSTSSELQSAHNIPYHREQFLNHVKQHYQHKDVSEKILWRIFKLVPSITCVAFRTDVKIGELPGFRSL